MRCNLPRPGEWKLPVSPAQPSDSDKRHRILFNEFLETFCLSSRPRVKQNRATH